MFILACTFFLCILNVFILIFEKYFRYFFIWLNTTIFTILWVALKKIGS